MPFTTMPAVVQFSVWWSLISLICFLETVPPAPPAPGEQGKDKGGAQTVEQSTATSGSNSTSPGETAKPTPSPTPATSLSTIASAVGTNQPINFSNWFWAASLGSAFYVLIKTGPYLVERTFDPKYNNAYVSRLVTGIVGGVILAYVLAMSKIGGDTVQKLGPAVIAIVGGFASEAVQQVLQRIAEVIMSAVRGDNSGQVKAQLAIDQAQTTVEGRGKIGDALAALKQNNTADAKTALEELDALLKKAPTK